MVKKVLFYFNFNYNFVSVSRFINYNLKITTMKKTIKSIAVTCIIGIMIAGGGQFSL
jgi:hypothetical protein